ncbi:hypothetical protein, partial [Salmonella enterica]|uniref:hypothetical protein n=1 Tax=Salmonella enterica TaxID=28901 RepID=UPI0016543D5B
VNALERTLGFKPDTSAESKLGRIDAFVQSRFGSAVPRYAALMAAMLSVPSDGHHDLPITSAYQREQDIIELMAELLDVRAKAEPLLFLFEDAHW